jgi:hypothetical protein
MPAASRLAAAVVTAAALGAIAGNAAAQSPLSDTARLEGQYSLTGTITSAFHVRDETVGQTVVRSWTFSPQCAAGPCETVTLTRQRATGIDVVPLHLVAPDQYSGSGRFYAPLKCRGRRNARGQSVPFTVTVDIVNAVLEGNTPVATQITATYTNRRRINRTKCVMPPAHDAAVYQGSRSG